MSINALSNSPPPDFDYKHVRPAKREIYKKVADLLVNIIAAHLSTEICDPNDDELVEEIAPNVYRRGFLLPDEDCTVIGFPMDSSVEVIFDGVRAKIEFCDKRAPRLESYPTGKLRRIAAELDDRLTTLRGDRWNWKF